MLLTDKERVRLDDLLLIRFQQISLPPLSLVHSYMAVPEQHEIDTHPILEYLQFRHPDLKLAIPKVADDQLVHFYYNEQTNLKTNEWGIPEPVTGSIADPEDIDLVLVPLLCFDEQGNRVGYGKGYYDRFLAACRPDVIKIGLSYFEATGLIDDHAGFDIPLSYCVTPNRLYGFD